jgi:hypothetical protein
MLPSTVGRQPSAALSHLKATDIKGHRVAKKTRKKLFVANIRCFDFDSTWPKSQKSKYWPTIGELVKNR